MTRSKKLFRDHGTSNGFGFEQLEQRELLTTFVVNSLVDDASGAVDGLISLREAIIAANTNMDFGDAVAGSADGDTIQFDPLLNGLISFQTEGEIEITDDLAILGGQSDLTIDALAASRIFNINTSETVSISRLNLTGGEADQGGAIFSNGTGTTLLNGLNVFSNSATGLGGGALFHQEGSLFITDSIFTGNTAVGASGSGGALLQQSGTVGFTNGALLENVANRAGGGIEIIDGNFFSNNLLVGDIGLGNVAGPAGTALPGNGGGLHVSGSASIVISGGQYVDNFAAREGGGLWNQAGSQMFVFDTLISDNVAAGASADDGGGGIFNNGGDLFVTDATITRNTATGTAGSGGGIFSTDGDVHINSTNISANVANRAGGGIEVVNGNLVLKDSILGGAMLVDGNIAGPMGTASPGNGGGLHVTGDGAEVIVRNTMVANNVAASEGGGLWNQAGSLLLVNSGSWINDNLAHGNEADTGGGGIFNNGGTLSVIDTTISGNIADGISGSGGGIFSTDGKVLIKNTMIQANIANRAGGGIEIINGRLDFNDSWLGGAIGAGNIAGPMEGANPGNGGGLHITGSSAQAFFRNSNVAYNIAASEGGGLWNQTGSLLRLDNTDVFLNQAHGDGSDNGGGGIFNNGGNVTIVDTGIFANVADGAAGSGGGIFTTDGRVLAFNSSIDDNDAARAGGGIEIVNGLMRINDSSLSHNEAGISITASPGNGGGLHVTGDAARVFIKASMVNENIAASEGGGLWNQAGSLLRVEQGTVVDSNEARGDEADTGGGGIFNNGGRLTVTGSTVSNNLATGISGSGGGIFSTDGRVLVFDSTINSNAAPRAGGGIEMIDGYARVTRTAVSNNDVGMTITGNPGNGGGLHISGNNAVFVSVDSSFTDNVAQNQGGGLWNQTDSRLRFEGSSRVINNHAIDGVGGGIYSRGEMEAIDAIFAENSAEGDGGGIFLTNTGSAFIFGSLIRGNDSDSNGGGIANFGSLRIEESNISNNIAGIDGGAIFTDPTATTVESRNAFNGNVPNDQN